MARGYANRARERGIVWPAVILAGSDFGVGGGRRGWDRYRPCAQRYLRAHSHRSSGSYGGWWRRASPLCADGLSGLPAGGYVAGRIAGAAGGLNGAMTAVFGLIVGIVLAVIWVLMAVLLLAGRFPGRL